MTPCLDKIYLRSPWPTSSAVWHYKSYGNWLKISQINGSLLLRIKKLSWPECIKFDTSNKMLTLREAPVGPKLIINSFNPDNFRDINDLESRLMHLGFIFNESITIRNRVNLKNGPLLVEVRGRLVALSPYEASLVTVEVLNEP